MREIRAGALSSVPCLRSNFCGPLGPRPHRASGVAVSEAGHAHGDGSEVIYASGDAVVHSPSGPLAAHGRRFRAEVHGLLD